MIFVTVGHKKFDRLIRAMDQVAAVDKEKVVMQIGYLPHFLPRHSEYFSFVKRSDMAEYFKNARIIISHCSVSLALYATVFSKPFILVPRLRLYKEVVDDHQLELARALEKEKMIDHLFVLYDLDMLEQTISKALNVNIRYVSSGKRTPLIKEIKKFIDCSASPPNRCLCIRR